MLGLLAAGGYKHQKMQSLKSSRNFVFHKNVKCEKNNSNPRFDFATFGGANQGPGSLEPTGAHLGPASDALLQRVICFLKNRKHIIQ